MVRAVRKLQNRASIAAALGLEKHINRKAHPCLVAPLKLSDPRAPFLAVAVRISVLPVAGGPSRVRRCANPEPLCQEDLERRCPALIALVFSLTLFWSAKLK